MLYDDAPIETIESDLLDRSSFSRKLAKSLLEMPSMSLKKTFLIS